MIAHPFIPCPWPTTKHLCDARVQQGGIVRQCGRLREEHEAPARTCVVPTCSEEGIHTRNRLGGKVGKGVRVCDLHRSSLDSQPAQLRTLAGERAKARST